MKLLKIATFDCPVCASLAEIDVIVAKEHGLDFECIDLEVFAQTEGSVRDYVVNYHVVPNKGIIDLPVYVICDSNGAQASAVVKDEAELHNLLSAWDLYNKSKSSDTKTV